MKSLVVLSKIQQEPLAKIILIRPLGKSSTMSSLMKISWYFIHNMLLVYQVIVSSGMLKLALSLGSPKGSSIAMEMVFDSPQQV